MGDHGAGMALAAGVCAALLHRERTGEGQLVHASLLRHGIYTIGFDLNTALRLGVPIGVATRETMGNPVINSYRDRDGRWFWLIGLEAERHWPDLARAVGHPEWLQDPRFATAAARRRHCAELVRLLDEIFATRPLSEWAETFDREGVWWAPVQRVEEVLADPQAWAAGAFVEVPDRGGAATMIATPVDFGATPWAVELPVPHLGEHTDEVLRELGHTQEEIAALRDQGALG
jgi:crotonobetainyl-CoA:carnitine CoA-transferase CaiB-like acyl-CoA transferase